MMTNDTYYGKVQVPCSLYDGPSENHKLIATLMPGASLVIMPRRDGLPADWMEVGFNGRVAYARTSAVAEG
jgi:hypothetical protein